MFGATKDRRHDHIRSIIDSLVGLARQWKQTNEANELAL